MTNDNGHAMSAAERADRLEGMVGRLAGTLVDLRETFAEALDAAEKIEPGGSPEWVESGVAMRTTIIRELRKALDDAEASA